MLKSTIEQDLKKAMLASNKALVEALRGLKSAILYKEVADGKREEGLSDEAIISVLKKELKSRQEAAELYRKGGAPERAETEEFQASVISSYLPEVLSEEETALLIDKALAELHIETVTMKDMGTLMAKVKMYNSQVEGSVVSSLIRQKIG